jgi:hypothetical protein
MQLYNICISIQIAFISELFWSFWNEESPSLSILSQYYWGSIILWYKVKELVTHIIIKLTRCAVISNICPLPNKYKRRSLLSTQHNKRRVNQEAIVGKMPKNYKWDRGKNKGTSNNDIIPYRHRHVSGFSKCYCTHYWESFGKEAGVLLSSLK